MLQNKIPGRYIEATEVRETRQKQSGADLMKDITFCAEDFDKKP
jgi:hypothetical protein